MSNTIPTSHDSRRRHRVPSDPRRGIRPQEENP